MAWVSRFTFERMCGLAAARMCYEDGQSVKQIAESAKVSECTVRRWLKAAGTVMRRK